MLISFKFYLFIYLWLCRVFVSVRGLSPVVAGGGHSSSQCTGLSLLQPLLLRSTGSRRAGSVVVAHGPSCSAACGILPGQGSNPHPLHWQADSQPLRHQGRPTSSFLIWFPFISFSSLIAVAKTSKTMLNNSGEGGQPCLVPDLSGNGFSFSPLRMILAVGLSYMAFIMLR